VITAGDLTIPEAGLPLLTRADGVAGADVCTEARELTAKQAAVIEAIARYHDATGEAPPVAWLARRLGISREGMRAHLIALYRKGWLLSPSAPALLRARL
jgi:hypothetical protein